MTDATTKAREFWIIDETPYSTWVSSKPLHSADTKEEVHVIEFSAFSKLQKENERLKKELVAKRTLDAMLADNKEICEQYDENDRLVAENQNLRDAVKVLRDALGEILDDGNAAAQGQWDATDDMRLRAYNGLLRCDSILGDITTKVGDGG